MRFYYIIELLFRNGIAPFFWLHEENQNTTFSDNLRRTKARNILERLRKYEGYVLRFMDNKNAPFTNNLDENDIKMTKVQQKISGCFRSLDGAKIFCHIRGYLSTCRKQRVNLSQALQMVFRGELPDFTRS